ncbi:MAG: tRNA (adenosine(37)-N6)-threonylcarbamoyltransferase complex dimerization subunit type 1 TsaB [candidate division KSB1 bacterium]|nr:tRNA (adenosine(37)-N6)-threonylcarbamoyltransferase complex dimerization subunit type 1 TsaB [candidate division KSB1 bacterium]
MILGIETATSICGVGIAEGERVMAEIRFNIKNIHAEVLSESIAHLLRITEIPLSRIAAIAVSIGPGSFTGLRIGLATAKGLAFAGEKSLVAVSTLLAQAAAITEQQKIIVPVIKAREGEIYTACFRSAWPAPVAVSEEVLLSINEFPQWFKQSASDSPVTLCGNGVAMLQSNGIIAELQNVINLPEAAAMLSGGLIARLGAIKYAAGEVADLTTLEPRYLQNFEIGPRKQQSL